MSTSEVDTDDQRRQLQYRRKLIENLTFEIVPLKSVDDAIDALPPQAEVSITCSPVKGIAETQRLTEAVRDRGHTAIPHVAARMVEGPAHAAELASWLRRERIGRLFLVGGDAETPAHYADAASFLRDLLDAGPELHTVGVTAYPDGHPAIGGPVLSHALHEKQALLTEAGVQGYASTQMCFDADVIAAWLGRERLRGLKLPIHLGIPGVVDRTKLLTMGARLGIGTSLSYLKKNRRAISRLLTRTDYDPEGLLEPLGSDLESLGVTGLHCFTFNQVASTEAWRQDFLGRV